MSDGGTGTTGLFDWIAKQIGRLPFVGGPIEDFLRAPAPVQRDIALLLAVLVLYPAYVFIGMIVAIQFISDGPRNWIQNQADISFDINSKIKSQTKKTIAREQLDINNDNSVIDGSSLFQFNVTRDNKLIGGRQRYIVRVWMDQPVSFQTYERADLYPFPSGAGKVNCQKTEIEDAVTNNHVGDLVVSGIGFNYFDAIPIQPSDRLTESVGLTPAEWNKVRSQLVPDNGDPRTVDFLVQFTPDEALTSPQSCTQYGIYVVMIYKKKPL